MQAPQIGVEPVLRIAVAVGRQCRGLDAVAVGAHRGTRLLDALVDVIAEKQHHVGIFVGEVPVGGKVAVLVIGARNESEPQAIDRRARNHQRRGASHRAFRIGADEPVPVGPPGLQASDVGMDRIAIGRFGRGDAAADDVAHGGIARDLVGDRNVAARHAAGRCRIGRERVGRQPRPQHEAVRSRCAGRDAETEGVAAVPALCLCPCAPDHGGRRNEAGGAERDQRAAVDRVTGGSTRKALRRRAP